MDIEIRDKFNKYIESHKQLRDLFDDLNEENGIALQYFFENFARSVLEQRQESRPHETIVKRQDILKWWKGLTAKDRDELVDKYFGSKRTTYQVNCRPSDVISIYEKENAA